MMNLVAVLFILSFFILIFGVIISFLFALASLLEKKWLMFFVSLIVLILVVLSIVGIQEDWFSPDPRRWYVMVGPYGDSFILDKLWNDKTTGKYIQSVSQDKVRIIYTQDKSKFDKFEWAFNWRQYRDIQEDVLKIIGEKNGIVYFKSKSTGKIRTFKK